MIVKTKTTATTMTILKTKIVMSTYISKVTETATKTVVVTVPPVAVIQTVTKEMSCSGTVVSTVTTSKLESTECAVEHVLLDVCGDLPFSNNAWWKAQFS